MSKQEQRNILIDIIKVTGSLQAIEIILNNKLFSLEEVFEPVKEMINKSIKDLEEIKTVMLKEIE